MPGDLVPRVTFECVNDDSDDDTPDVLSELDDPLDLLLEFDDPPRWLLGLPPLDIAQLLADPEMEMPKIMKAQLPTGVWVETSWVARLSTETQLWKLGPTHVEEVKQARRRLDTWWASRPERLKSSVLGRTSPAAPIAGEFREHFEKLGVGGEITSDAGPLGPFRPSPLVRGYLAAITPKKTVRDLR